MKRGFYIIMGAQFFSALADHALLVTAMAVMRSMGESQAHEQFLKSGYTLSFVLFAPFVGAFADSLPKSRVMLLTNTIKIIGCISMFLGLSPIAAYAIVGFGAAAYSPAKYGILTELLPAEKLVVANGWIEALTVAAIVFGNVIGGGLIHPAMLSFYESISFSHIIAGEGSRFAVLLCCSLYMIAGLFNMGIPSTGIKMIPFKPYRTIPEFIRSFFSLWKDREGRISLTVTTIFWGAAGALHIIVLQWAQEKLGLDLHEAPLMQVLVAVGTIVGAIIAGRNLGLKDALKLVPVGIAMGVGLFFMIPIRSIVPAGILVFIIGALAGFFLVPMNALLQHRGHSIMTSGQSISVQNFNENGCILGMTIAIGAFQSTGGSLMSAIVSLGGFVALSMIVVQLVIYKQGLLSRKES